MKPLALDLFCCAGGASMGLHRAGFDVIGVDIKPQPRYPFRFVQADALRPPFDLRRFAFIWASPPCQKHSALRHLTGKSYPDLIPQTREMLEASGVLYVIENVPGAPLRNPVVLCGSRFGLRVRRHRLFESRFLGLPGIYVRGGCDHRFQGQPIDVSGTGTRRRGARLDGAGGNSNKPRSTREAQCAIGIDWMTRPEIAQAIPPAYGEFIGRAALAHLSAHGQSTGE